MPRRKEVVRWQDVVEAAHAAAASDSPVGREVVLSRWTRDLEPRSLVHPAALLSSWAMWSDERKPPSVAAIGRALAAAGCTPVTTMVRGVRTRTWTLPSRMPMPSRARDLEERMTAVEAAIVALRIALAGRSG